MKKISCLFVVFIFTGHLYGQQAHDTKQHELQQAVVNMFQALSDRDSTALRYFCDPKVTFYEYGEIWSLDTLIRKAIRSNQSPDFLRTNTFDFIHTESAKSTAWVTYRLNSTMVKAGKTTNVQWLETVVLVRRGKQWKVRHLHSTLL